MAHSDTSKANSHARQLILHARHHDPFSFLGQHSCHDNDGEHFAYRVFLPQADEVYVKSGEIWNKLEKTHRDGLFELNFSSRLASPCLLKVTAGSHSFEMSDP